ncbi:MAG: hypothetical protein MRJ93_11620 [Nitrososphaeraceae archaeon]|nr:hypothetical protein [Nitrososphaeraceae archaeon]
MQRYKATGFSLRKEILSKIDSERGDISRSRYLQRILENYYHLVREPQENKKEDGRSDLSDSLVATPGSDRSLNT